MKDKLKVRGQLQAYLTWPLFMSVPLVCANLVVATQAPVAGAVMSLFTFVYVFISVWFFFTRRRRILSGLIEFSSEYTSAQKQLLANLGLPYALADYDGRVIWMNEGFAQVLGTGKGAGKSLVALFPGLTKEHLYEEGPVTQVHTSYGDKKYRMDIKPIHLDSLDEVARELDAEPEPAKGKPVSRAQSARKAANILRLRPAKPAKNSSHLRPVERSEPNQHLRPAEKQRGDTHSRLHLAEKNDERLHLTNRQDTHPYRSSAEREDAHPHTHPAEREGAHPHLRPAEHPGTILHPRAAEGVEPFQPPRLAEPGDPPLLLHSMELAEAQANPSAAEKMGRLLAVYLFDETEIVKIKQEIGEQKMVAGLIYLDNYEEALESVEEVRRSLLTALIDRKINKYIAGMSGFVKKMEKDKYFFAIKQRYVEQIKEERFSILEEVKAVNIGNEMAVTLSIGMGINGEEYNQNYDYARVAIDMALGRGGDQAVLKDGAKIQYFGGKSQQLEKATRVKARVKAHAMRELMESKDRFFIMGHKMPDIDSFGAAVGIYRIAATLGKKAHVVINEVTSSVRPMKERFTENSDYPDDMFLTSGQAAELVDSNSMLVVVDVNRPSITDAPELLRMIKTIVVLDHHRQSSEIIDNAVLSYVEPYASSACEMVAEILQYVADGIKVKSPEADAMYAGIIIDTNNFTNQTGVRTFEAAAYLRRSGADVTRVRKLFREEMVNYKARAETIRSAEIYREAFAIGTCPADGLESPTIVGAQAANEMLDIVGMKASIVFTEYNGTLYLSARSIDEVNVQVMMEQLGGGGHRTIAGAQMSQTTVLAAKERLKEIIDQMIEKGDIL